MRQVVLIVVLVAALALCVGCGGGSSSSTAANSIIVSPASLSLNQGDVLGLTATVLDSSGSPVANPKAVVWTTSNANVATVTSDSGGVCGGIWDSNHVVCAPGTVGTATITATSGSLTASATIYVHKKVDRVVISTPTGACKSMGQTLQLTATALSSGTDVTSTVGPFTWSVGSPAVATIDANGILTASAPGQTPIYASISNITSVPVTYTTCAVKSIHIHVSGAPDTAFTLGSIGATQTLAADVTDTAGNTITPTLTWASNGPGIISMSTPTGTTGAASTSTQTATGNTPGVTGVVAECALNCNYNLTPVYSDVAVGTVSGTNATTVYVTGTGTTSLIPIDTGTNTAATAITLPDKPNSFIFDQLAVTPDASKILAVDSPNLDVMTRTSLAQPGCPPPLSATVSTVNLGQGAFTLKSFVLTTSGAKAYIVSNLTNVIVYDVASATPSTIALANGASGLSASATQDGTKLYVGGSDKNVHRIDTATATDAQQISVSFTPDLVAVRPK